MTGNEKIERGQRERMTGLKRQRRRKRETEKHGEKEGEWGERGRIL